MFIDCTRSIEHWICSCGQCEIANVVWKAEAGIDVEVDKIGDGQDEPVAEKITAFWYLQFVKYKCCKEYRIQYHQCNRRLYYRTQKISAVEHMYQCWKLCRRHIQHNSLKMFITLKHAEIVQVGWTSIWQCRWDKGRISTVEMMLIESGKSVHWFEIQKQQH